MSRALGRYELLRPLARGGMGEVYLARRRAAGLEKWLVVKRMRPERSGDTRFLDLFMREAKLSMSLAHQNIVPVFDFGRIDDQVFLAMERVEGRDLGSTLQKVGAGMPPLLAAFVAAECLQALDYAHRRKGPDGAPLGIVHRDVTPRNVLLSWSGEVKLTDFGIAALAGDSPSRTIGTPAYMAPEQARGDTLDLRADIYAVGLVLREALVGERARRGNDRETVLEIAKQGALDPWPDGFDTPLRAIVERATALDREARYPDARTMLEELDAFILAERSAHKGEAPARRLADWLAEIWKDAREDEQIDAQIEAGELVSFLDDGGLDAIGTGTQRSMLATAADASASAPAEPEAQRAAPPEAAPADRAESSDRAPVPIPATPPARSASGVWALAGLLIASGLAVVVFATRGTAPDQPARATAPAPAPADAARIAHATADAGVEATPIATDAVAQPELAAPADAAAVEPEAPTEGSAQRGPRLRPRPTTAPPSPDAAVATPPAVGTRKVTINSRPWSNWTVDGGPQHAGLDTVELTPGPHVIHFTGNPYFKADKKVTIDVPDEDGFTYVETLEPAPAP